MTQAIVMEILHHDKKSMFDSLAPKIAFFVGLGGGVMALCTVGFFVLLAVFLTRGGFPTSALPANVRVAQAPTPSAAPSPEDGGGSITIKAVSKDDHIRGEAGAKVTIVEYSDLECPFCKRFHPTLKELLDNNKGKIKWVYRHFPLTSLHSKAPKEAEATECATELGGNDGFWKYTDRLYEITPANNGLDSAQLPQIAQDVGLNRKKFEDCLASGKYAKKVQEQAADAVAAGGRGTPHSVFLGPKGEKVPVSGALPLESLQAVLDDLLG